MFHLEYLKDLAKQRKFVKAEVQVRPHRLIIELKKISSVAYIHMEKGNKILLRSWSGIDVNAHSGVVFHQFPIPNDGWEITEER